MMLLITCVDGERNPSEIPTISSPEMESAESLFLQNYCLLGYSFIKMSLIHQKNKNLDVLPSQFKVLQGY